MTLIPISPSIHDLNIVSCHSGNTLYVHLVRHCITTKTIYVIPLISHEWCPLCCQDLAAQVKLALHYFNMKTNAESEHTLRNI